jgi:hypothetical protein
MKPLIRTRQKTVSPLLSALTGKVPLQPNKVVNLALKPYLALDCFARSQGNNYLYGTLVQYALISQYLCNKGYLRENLDIAVKASEELVPVAARCIRNGVWALLPSEHKSMCDVLATFHSQLGVAGLEDVMEAHAMVMDRLMSLLSKEPAKASQAPAKETALA